MRLTFLGTGASGGVPLYGCDCPACERARLDPTFLRRPCSATVESDGVRILIDAGLTDLHERFAPGTLSAILLTHYHTDHVQGLFHLRWGMGNDIPVLSPSDPVGCADLYKHPGLLDFQPLRPFEPVRTGPFKLTPLPLIHSKLTFGYAIEHAAGARFAYLTDTLGLPPEVVEFLKAWGDFELALDCTHPPISKPSNHNDWSAALASIAAVEPQHTWLTHLSHEHDAWRLVCDSPLPPTITYAHDGASVHIRSPDNS